MEQKIVPEKTIVLRPKPLSDVQIVANKKKTSFYGTVFNRPKPEEVDISSIDLYYEPYWIVGGQYTVDYFRKSIYEIATGPEVKEVVIGKGTFPVRTKSGTWKKIRSSIKVGEKENILNIPVEEHVELDIEDEITINAQGKEIKFRYKMKSEDFENFPEDVLKNNENHVRHCVVNKEQAVDTLIKILHEDIDNEIRILNEKVVIDRLDQVYVPVYEARCVDSNNKVETMRIDGMDLKIL